MAARGERFKVYLKKMRENKVEIWAQQHQTQRHRVCSTLCSTAELTSWKRNIFSSMLYNCIVMHADKWSALLILHLSTNVHSWPKNLLKSRSLSERSCSGESGWGGCLQPRYWMIQETLIWCYIEWCSSFEEVEAEGGAGSSEAFKVVHVTGWAVRSAGWVQVFC